MEASEEGRLMQSSSITFDKDNPSGSILSGAAAKDSEPLGFEPESNPMAQPAELPCGLGRGLCPADSDADSVGI